MQKALTAIGILLIVFGLGAADALFVEGGLPKAVLPDEVETSQPPQTSSSSTDQQTSEGNEVSSTGIRKTSGPDVLATLGAMGFEVQDSTELTILRTVIPAQEATVTTKALLLNGDRAGLIAWTESPAVKTYYLSLKEALHASFSPQVSDLLDETQRIPGKPPRNFLTFLDPGISAERMVFLRVRERLYEIRIAEGNDDVMFQLVEKLTE